VLIGIAAGCWKLADLAWAGLAQLGEVPFPSWADPVYLAAYPALTLAVGLMLRRSGGRDAVAWQEAGIWSLTVLLLTWEPILEPALETPGASALARAVAVAYPAADLLLLLFVLRLVSGVRGKGPQTVLAAVLGCYLVSDTVYAMQALTGTYVEGGVVDLGWLLAYVGIGALALHPRMAELTASDTFAPARIDRRWRLLLLGAATLLPAAILAGHEAMGDPEAEDVLVLAAVAAGLAVLTTLRATSLLRELEGTTQALLLREADLSHRASTDALTGLANRHRLHERMNHELQRGRQFSVALLDLDDFKNVNDERGHEVGDALLLAVAERLTTLLPEQDLVGRLGGDEFAVISCSPPEELAAVVLSCLRRPLSVDGLELLLRGSVGVADSTHGQATSSELLRDADIAMYSAKSSGGNLASVHRPEMSARFLDRLETRRRLFQAVARQEFVAYLQPVVDLTTYRLIGFEALARWQRPGGAPVAPGGWMDAAEETGLISAIDGQVLRAAARQVVAWSATLPGAASLDLAINASGRSLQEPDVAEKVLAILLDEGLDPSRLVLEVTEGVMIDETVGSRLQALREAGVRIALDDFGTGWSSLAYLRRFPVDVLKIDRSFVTGVDGGAGAEAIAAAVLHLAAALDLDVIAEGVETPEQARVLRRLGCRLAQGYLLGRPLPFDAVEQLVRRGRVPGGPSVVAVPAPRVRPGAGQRAQS
jgi:diguanylate cyclase (GGDEF)-like protein